jgi:AcrR family transcriptional regulator
VDTVSDGESARDIYSSIKDKDLLNARRAHLVQAATRLFVERGFSNVSVNEIADVAGISIGSVYKYVRTKEDILWLVVDSLHRHVEDFLMKEPDEQESPSERLRSTFERFLRTVDGMRRDVVSVYREYGHLPPEGQREFMRRERRIVEEFAKIIEAGNQAGEFHCRNPETAALTLLMIGHTWAFKRWMMKHLSLEDYVQRQLEAAFALVGASSPP